MKLAFNTVGNPLNNPREINRNFLRQGSLVDFSQFRDLSGNRKAEVTGTVARSYDTKYGLNYGPFSSSTYMNFGTPLDFTDGFTFFAVLKVLSSVNSYPISCKSSGGGQGFEIIAGSASTVGQISAAFDGASSSGFAQVNLSSENNWIVVVASIQSPIFSLYVYEPDAAPSSRNLVDIDFASFSSISPSAPYALNDRGASRGYVGHIASHGFMHRGMSANTAQQFSKTYYETLLQQGDIPSLLNANFPTPSVPIIPAGFQNLDDQYSSISALKLGGVIQ